MDSPTDKVAEADLTTCYLCLETLKYPKYFPCLHSFCEGCVNVYILKYFDSTKGGVSCPVCRLFVNKPNDINTEDWSSELPTNHILVSLIDMNKPKSESKHCTECARDNETVHALSWCVNCSEALCCSCERSHRRNKASSSHTLIDINNKDCPPSVPQEMNVSCSEHKDKMLEAYCRDHSVICCVTCVMLKHRTCANVASIADAVSELQKTVKEINLDEKVREIKLLMENNNRSLEKLERDSRKVKLDIESLFKEITDHMEKLKAREMSELSKLETEFRSKLKASQTELENKLSEVNLALSQSVTENTAPIQFLLVAGTMLKQRESIESFFKDQRMDTTFSGVTFEVNRKLVEQVLRIMDFGKVQVPTTKAAVRGQVFVAKDSFIKSSLSPVLLVSDNTRCTVPGIVLLRNGNVLFSNCRNKSLELRDIERNVTLSTLSLTDLPRAIKMISEDEGVVAKDYSGLVFFMIKNDQILKMSDLPIKVNCDLVCLYKEFYVGCIYSFTVLNSDKTIVKEVKLPTDVAYMAVRDDTSICYTVRGSGTLYCVTLDGTSIFTYSHNQLRDTRGVTVDHAGRIYVCGRASRNIHQLSYHGKLIRILFDDLAAQPYCISFNSKGDRAVIGCDNKIMLYDLNME